MNNGSHGKKAEIWAIGGGKGGTGKSFITSCLGTSLTLKGRRVVLIDADLGGANLHTFLGISRPKNSLADFFERKLALNHIIDNCGISNLGLVTGSFNSLDSENIKYAQKLKLFRHIKSLDTDYVLIDLGAGSHNNTMDTFLLADKMLVVIVPEITAIENMYHFVKNVFFRKLKLTIGEHGLKDTVKDVWKNRELYGIKNMRELIEHLMGMSTHVRDILEREISGFRIHLILNQTKSGKDLLIGTSIKSVCMKFLGFDVQYAGYIGYDDYVPVCINNKRSFLLTYPFSHVTKEIGKLLDNIMEEKEIMISRSGYVCRGA